ncbi:MAG TPA: hypothetical protein PK006_09000 [Saprospiraceae bacterium]|nr:hypothetical protein [Saprospiraceae bacterium]
MLYAVSLPLVVSESFRLAVRSVLCTVTFGDTVQPLHSYKLQDMYKLHFILVKEYNLFFFYAIYPAVLTYIRQCKE